MRENLENTNRAFTLEENDRYLELQEDYKRFETLRIDPERFGAVNYVSVQQLSDDLKLWDNIKNGGELSKMPPKDKYHSNGSLMSIDERIEFIEQTFANQICTVEQQALRSKDVRKERAVEILSDFDEYGIEPYYSRLEGVSAVLQEGGNMVYKDSRFKVGDKVRYLGDNSNNPDKLQHGAVLTVVDYDTGYVDYDERMKYIGDHEVNHVGNNYAFELCEKVKEESLESDSKNIERKAALQQCLDDAERIAKENDTEMEM